MDIYRIIPTTGTPERQSVTRRERERKEHRDGEKNPPSGKARGVRSSEGAEPVEAQVVEEQGKGRRLNVSA